MFQFNEHRTLLRHQKTYMMSIKAISDSLENHKIMACIVL